MRKRLIPASLAGISITFAVATGCLSTNLAMADEAFPTRPVTIVVPSEAGSAPDALARLVTTSMGRQLGQPVIVDNRAGAAGNIGATAVARAPADGHTLLMMTTVHTISASTVAKLAYSPVSSFTPVEMVATSALVLVAPANAPIRDLKGLLSQARAKPDTMNFATPGKGSIQHLATEMLARKAGVTMTHVPYKSGAAAALSVASGETQVAFVSVPVALPLVKAGRLVALGVSSASPSESFPGVPTIAQALGTDFQVANWFALVAPAGTPEPAVRRLNAALNEALAQADVREQFARAGTPARPSTPARLGQDIVRETANWKHLIDNAKIRLND